MDSRVWFVEHLTSAISGLYFQSRANARFMDRERWIGHVIAWSSLLLTVGGNPEKFLAPEDIQIVKKEIRG